MPGFGKSGTSRMRTFKLCMCLMDASFSILYLLLLCTCCCFVLVAALYLVLCTLQSLGLELSCPLARSQAAKVPVNQAATKRSTKYKAQSTNHKVLSCSKYLISRS